MSERSSQRLGARDIPLTANIKINPRLQKPIMLCKSCEGRHPTPVNSQASSPRLNPGPPHHDTRECEQDEQERADPVDVATSAPGEQIVVQIEEPSDGSETEWHRITQVLACVWIEEASCAISIAFQKHFDCLIGILRPTDDDRVLGVCARCRPRQLLIG